MSVSGVGGPASLSGLVPLQASSPAVPATGSTTSTGSSELRLPGKHATSAPTATTKHEEIPKPKALPPLRGLTVAEIRAMLGVAPLPGMTEPSSPVPTTAGVTATGVTAATSAGQVGGYERYA
jgi:hypothetical protein